MEQYRLQLRNGAAMSLERPWSRCWPSWPSEHLQIHHTQKGALFSAEEAVQQAVVDRVGATKAICAIENISEEWAVQLGVAWNIPVDFFLEYLKAPEAELSKRTINEARLPGTSGALRSGRGGAQWMTLRGVVDFGQLPWADLETETDEDTIRLEGRSDSGRYFQTTNFSVFSVHDRLDLMLVDRASSNERYFHLDRDLKFPRQIMVRLANVDWPGHVCFPELRPPCDTAVLPIWTLFYDEYTAEALASSLQAYGIDDFLYQASVFECQRHLNALLARIRVISLQDIPEGEETIMRELRYARQALNRLYRCIEENKSHERAYARTLRASDAPRSTTDRTKFGQLAKEVQDLEQTILRDMKVLMMTMSTRDVANSLRLTEATHRQSRSMTLLTWLMMVYAPLSCAAAVFGMNLQQLNHTGLHVLWFVGVAMLLLGGTLALVVVCRRVDAAMQEREGAGGQPWGWSVRGWSRGLWRVMRDRWDSALRRMSARSRGGSSPSSSSAVSSSTAKAAEMV